MSAVWVGGEAPGLAGDADSCYESATCPGDAASLDSYGCLEDEWFDIDDTALRDMDTKDFIVLKKSAPQAARRILANRRRLLRGRLYTRHYKERCRSKVQLSCKRLEEVTAECNELKRQNRELLKALQALKEVRT